MTALGKAVADAGGGVVEVASDIGLGGLEGDFGSDIDWMRHLAVEHGLTVTYALAQVDARPEQWRELLDLSSAPIEGEGRVVAQVAGRPAGLLLGFETSLNPFMKHPTYLALADLPFEERVAELRSPRPRLRSWPRRPRSPVASTATSPTAFTRCIPLGTEPRLRARPRRLHRRPSRARGP